MRLVIAGAGGHGRELYSWVEGSPRYRQAHEIDSVVYINDIAAPRLRAPVIASIFDYVPAVGDRLLCAIGDPHARRDVTLKLSARGAQFARFVHDTAVMGSTVEIEDGVVICPRVTLSSEVVVRAHAHVNVGAIVSHDVEIGQFAMLAPGSILLGNSSVGDLAYIGAGAVVLPGTQVGAGAMVGAQAAVVHEVGDGNTVVGVPARRLPNRD